MKLRLRIRALVFVAIASMVFAACGTDVSDNGDVADREINVVATTGMITDAMRNVGGDRVDVTGLMGPGVDPHLYRPTASDVSALENADIIFYNGLELEGRMTDIFVRLAASKPTVAVTEGLPEDRLQEPPAFQGKYDPHVWFDVDLWSLTIQNVQQALAEIDPDSAELYQTNADSYVAELRELDSYVQEQIDTIPEAGRILITAHDAFGYFGLRYGVEVIGLQGTSTAAEAGAADVQSLSRLIVERQIKAIFVESSVPRATIEAVQSAVESGGHEVAIGGELFSDAMGADGTPEGTYIGMVRHNVDTIAGALR